MINPIRFTDIGTFSSLHSEQEGAAGRSCSTSTSWVGSIVNNTAGTACCNRRWVTSAALSIEWRNVNTTVLSLVVITVESNVAGFTIGGRPGIANQPEALAILATVADQDYDVVQIRLSLVAAVENTAIISMPVAGVDSDCKRTDLGERVHYLTVAVFSKLNKA